MATIKYRLKTKTENAQIYIRFSISRTQVFETKTGLSIDHNNWSTTTGFPKQNNPQNKNLKSDLEELATFINKEYNSDFSKGVIFSTQWLKSKINESFERDQITEDKNLFSVFLDSYKDTLIPEGYKTRASYQKFNQLYKKFTAFEKKKSRKYFIVEIDKPLMLEFKKYLMGEGKMMESTANRTLKRVKSVLIKARDEGKTINHQINNFRIEMIPAIKVFLSFDEIEKIKNEKIIGGEIDFARDWLIIGCYTGQRVSDLLRMKKEMIYTKTDSEGNSYKFIDLIQEKTKKPVTIPLHDEVQIILDKYDGDFPPIFGKTKASNSTLFNRYIKTVCRLAGINDVVKGRLFNDDENVKRNEIVQKEKYNFVSSHICRRSFATNFYGDKRFTTPQLMAITGHGSESIFLSYIGKKSSDHAFQTAKAFQEIKREKSEKTS
ncbi:MAG: phage integrase SAM-like domain-containing protein [Flavobacteriales bacterium]|nr:phage integrase SAM-like domain-containing protein [Flavobacteriales bacterium]